jgi:hypothetical protein
MTGGNNFWVHGSGFVPGHWVSLSGAYSLDGSTGQWNTSAQANSYGFIVASLYAPAAIGRGQGYTIEARIGGVTVATASLWIQ